MIGAVVGAVEGGDANWGSDESAAGFVVGALVRSVVGPAVRLAVAQGKRKGAWSKLPTFGSSTLGLSGGGCRARDGVRSGLVDVELGDGSGSVVVCVRNSDRVFSGWGRRAGRWDPRIGTFLFPQDKRGPWRWLVPRVGW